jgi:predicted ester cyclase
VHGPTAMRGTAEWLLGQFPDLSMRIESIVADEDMVAVRVRSTGTNSGKLNGFLPPSGKRFTSEQSH